jgi:hypothetical protein
VPVTDFSMGSPSLDDVFFALTGRPAQASQDGGHNKDGDKNNDRGDQAAKESAA